MSAETPRVGDVIKASHYEFIVSGIAELSRLRRQHAAALAEIDEFHTAATGWIRTTAVRAALEETP